MKLLILANCQSSALAAICSKIQKQDGTLLFTILPVKPTYELTGDDLPYLEECLEACDVLLYQPHLNFPTEWRTSAYWLSAISTAKAISFQSLYFSAYNPELTYLRDHINRHLNEGFVDYHDKRIVKLFLDGKSTEEISNLFQHIQPIEGDIKSIYQETLAEMRRRESEQKLDIKVSDFVESNFRSQRLFYTYNHPSNALLYEVVKQFLALLGQEELIIPVINNELLRFDDFPIAPMVKETLGLTFPMKDEYLVQSKRYTKTELVARYFDIYSDKIDWVDFAAKKIRSEVWLNRKKVVFYIGSTRSFKTGLLKPIEKSLAELGIAGMLFPKTGGTSFGHSFLSLHYGAGVPQDKLIETIKTEISNSTTDIALIASDNLSSLDKEEVQKLLMDFREFDIYSVSLLDSRASWVQSMYSEYVMKNWLSLSFEELVAYISQPWTLPRKLLCRLKTGKRQYSIIRSFSRSLEDIKAIQPWISSLSTGHCHVASSEDMNLWGFLNEVFGTNIKLPAPDINDLNFSPLSIEMARKFYANHKMEEVSYDVAVTFLQRLETELKQSKFSISINSFFSSKEQLNAFVVHYIQPDRWLSSKFLITRNTIFDQHTMKFFDKQLFEKIYQNLKKDLVKWFDDSL